MAQETRIDALLALKSNGRLLVGRDRIAVLQAVADHGSIAKAAQICGCSYKSAWDAVAAINNLLPSPAVLPRAGGRQGGSTLVTEAGQRLIVAFNRLEEKLSRISTLMAAEGLDAHPDLLFWSVAMKTSARNAFRCSVVDVKHAAVNTEIILKMSETHRISAVVTGESATKLGLAPGREAVALVKSSFVMLAPFAQTARLSTPNRLDGSVIGRIDGGVNSQVILDIGAGKTLVAVISRQSADDLAIGENDRLCAYFSPSHVILAVD